MYRWLLGGLVLLLAGCSWGTYQIPKQDYREKVQVLGVLPLLVDRSAAFDYPQKESLLDLLSRSVTGKQDILVERLREKKGYFDVRSLSVNADLTALSLLSGGRQLDAEGYPQSYRFDPATVARLASDNAVDALLVVVISGATIKETRRSRNLLESLNTGYNDLVATAAVIDSRGLKLWQLAGRDTYRVLTLQYADFDEAYFNRSELVKVKNISLSGIEKVLEEGADGKQRTRLPAVYDKLFDRIVSGLSPGLFDAL